MADPDLPIRGGVGGGVHPDPRIRGRAVSKIFSVLRASVWAKIGAGGRVPRAPPVEQVIQSTYFWVTNQDKFLTCKSNWKEKILLLKTWINYKN